MHYSHAYNYMHMYVCIANIVIQAKGKIKLNIYSNYATSYIVHTYSYTTKSLMFYIAKVYSSIHG